VLLNLLADIAGAFADPRVRMADRGLIARPRVLSGLPALPRAATPVSAAVLVAALGFVVWHAQAGRHGPAPVVLVGPVQTLAVRWAETHDLRPPRYSVGVPLSGAVAIRVRAISIARNGWRVEATVTNKSRSGLAIGAGELSYPSQGFSLLYPERSSAGLNTLHVLPATSFDPSLPDTLGPGASWSGSFSGLGAVPRPSQLYVGFGTFASAGTGTHLGVGASFVTSGTAQLKR
jgi:hypothetical protein